jgi:coenzyme F420-reducing hydrogenase delta subunit
MSLDFEPEVVVLYCQNAVDKNVSLSNSSRRLDGCKARFIIMPCSSKVEQEYLVKILEQGADAVQVVGCPERACRFLVGNTKAERRVELVKRWLTEIGYGAERAAMVRGAGLSQEALIEQARLRAQAVLPLGPNPMKSGPKK